ncbi:MAG TPA: M20 family metallopeptidase [Dehalococcoidales bacterium]|nr:M20 family metallopeptidase [Dehalococcoidales bacterium]
MDIVKLKKSIGKDIDSGYNALRALSRDLHDNPETAMQEKKACAWLCAHLEKLGYKVKKGVAGLPTAFKAEYGSGRPAIAFMAEYDALRKIGHGCGHNLIATSTVAAALGARRVVDELGGRIIVYGTPGEEGAGGKVIMAREGAFDDADVAMEIHPGGGHHVLTYALTVQNLEVEFLGKAAHAAAEPQIGVNALAAMILSFNAIDALRQHIKPAERIHGIITDGGEAANIVPAHTAASFMVRAVTDADLDALEPRVLNCFVGAAAATGAELKYKWDPMRFSYINNNHVMAELFQKNIEALGITMPLGEEKFTGSTDVGNVSLIIPTIHPFMGIAPAAMPTHSPEFARIAGTEDALKRVLEAAKAMAMTAADLLASPAALKKVKAEFKQA